MLQLSISVLAVDWLRSVELLLGSSCFDSSSCPVYVHAKSLLSSVEEL